MALNPWLTNLWLRSAPESRRFKNLREDWSWLTPKPVPKYGDLVKSEWSEERTKTLLLAGFHSLDIERCRNRMIMGAMRYGLLKDKTYLKYSKEFYQDRLRLEWERSTANLEAIYDSINVVHLMFLSGHIKSEYQYLFKLLARLRQGEAIGIPFFGEDRV